MKGKDIRGNSECKTAPRDGGELNYDLVEVRLPIDKLQVNRKKN